MSDMLGRDPGLTALGTRPLCIDASPSGSAYGLATDPTYIELSAVRTWGADVADFESTPTGDWAFVNTAVQGSSISSAELVLVGTNASYDWTGGAQTSPLICHGTYALGQDDVICVRLRASVLGASMYAYAQLTQTDGAASFVQIGFQGSGSANAGIIYPAGATITDTQRSTTGVWFMFRVRGIVVDTYYSLANQATAPNGRDAAWTYLTTKSTFSAVGKLYKLGVALSAGGTGPTVQVMHIDDRRATAMFGSGNQPGGARGVDTTGPVLTLTASDDIGAAAVIVDADLQASLTNAVNRRHWDAGVWTFSAVRGSSANPGASTYQAAGSVTVSGTGRYFALYAKCTSSTAVMNGSLHIPSLTHIPVTG